MLPQGFRGWALWAVAQAGFTLAYKLAYKLVENAMIGWGDDKIAAWFGITSPDASTVFDWAVPFLLAAVTLATYHALHSSQPNIASRTINERQGRYRTNIVSQIPRRLYVQAKTAHSALGSRVIIAWILTVICSFGLIGGIVMLAMGPRKIAPMATIPRDSMLSGRPVSGLEIASRLQRLEKEHARTVAELAAAKEQLATKNQELVKAGSSVTVTATKIPPAQYNKAQIGKILEAIDVFHSTLLRMGQTLNDAKGLTGSLEGIVSSEGAATFLERMNGFRLIYLSPSDDFDRAYQDYSLYTEVTRVVAEKQLHHDPLFAAYNDLAGLLRDLPDKLTVPALASIVKAKKDTFKTRVDDYFEWVTAKKKALEEYREWYLRHPTTD
jgi:hypothetical protein